MTGIYRIADKNILINSVYEKVQEMCADYVFDGEPDITVTVTEADIDAEAERSDRENAARGNKPSVHIPAYIETLAVYRSIAVEMLAFDTFLMHGSVIAVDGTAYMFTAPSGTGKSTHARLWRETLGDRAFMVNDDKPLIRVSSGTVTAYGTPWNGKHRLGTNIGVPLGAVCLLERSDVNRVEPVDKLAAYPAVLRQIFRPDDPEKMKVTLGLADRMLRNVRLYRIMCNMDKSAALTAQKTLLNNC